MHNVHHGHEQQRTIAKGQHDALHHSHTNFPPAIGGMQLVMSALAKKLSKNAPVIIYPDTHVKMTGVSIKHTAMMKPLRPLVKRFHLWRSLQDDDIIICDSWRSLNAIPETNCPIIVLAHGQEFIISKPT